MSDALSDFERIQAGLLAVNTEQSAAGEQLQELHELATHVAAQARAFVRQIEAALIEHMNATGERVQCGDGRYWYVGSKKRTVARDDAAVLAAVLEAASGDLGVLKTGDGGVLSAGCWKVGACRSLLGERFDALFETTMEADLQTGKMVKELKVQDERFTKKGLQNGQQ